MEFAEDDLTGYAITGISGGGALFKTTDGGATWTNISITVLGSTASYSLDVGSTTPAVRVLVGPGASPVVIVWGVIDISAAYYGAAWRSTDGGATWREMKPNTRTPSSQSYGPFLVKAGRRLMYASRDGLWSYTVDDAWADASVASVSFTLATNSWHPGSSGKYFVQAFNCYDSNVCVAVDNNSEKKAYYTTNGGTTWTYASDTANWNGILVMPTATSVIRPSTSGDTVDFSADLYRSWVSRTPLWNPSTAEATKMVMLNATHMAITTGSSRQKNGSLWVTTSDDGWASMRATHSAVISKTTGVSNLVIRNATFAWATTNSAGDKMLMKVSCP